MTLRAELDAIDPDTAATAQVGMQSMGQTNLDDEQELADYRTVNGDPDGVVDCHGCGYRLAATRERCPKCNTGIRLILAPDTREAQLQAHTERIRTATATTAPKSSATAAALATGCPMGTPGYKAAYMRAYNHIRGQNPAKRGH